LTNTKQGTGVSSPFGGPEPPRGDTGGGFSYAGLVLLFAPNFAQFQPAYLLSAQTLTIGRDASNAVCVPEQAVSRQHARVEWNGERWMLSDLGSRNGTIVDGQYVRQLELDQGCEIRVGDAIFKFVETGAEKFVAYRIDGTCGAERRAKMLYEELVGGAQMDRIAADLERIARTELSCVILGETGTGKEVAARGLHRASERTGSFQAINCAAIPHNLLESELFGYRRGAFSGADRDKPGLIKSADGGTLFLDEIGDMPLEAQAKMLRVLQAREVFPLGATTPERVDIRVVCATHRDLLGYVKEGRFRGDLFARLNEHVVRLPPLAERKEDIFLLSQVFVKRYAAATSFPAPKLTFPFMMALLHYDWPFNVRELESCIKRAVALCAGAPLDRAHLPDAIREHMRTYSDKGAGAPQPAQPPRAASAPPTLRGTPSEAELRELLAKHKGNVAAVGREFNKERMQVHRWLRKYNIDVNTYRD